MIVDCPGLRPTVAALAVIVLGCIVVVAWRDYFRRKPRRGKGKRHVR